LYLLGIAVSERTRVLKLAHSASMSESGTSAMNCGTKPRVSRMSASTSARDIGPPFCRGVRHRPFRRAASLPTIVTIGATVLKPPTFKIMCIRCSEPHAPEPLGLCAVCAIQTRIELTEGFRRLGGYLEAWAAFGVWLEERGLQPAP
jgi:hypothetical protein